MLEIDCRKCTNCDLENGCKLYGNNPDAAAKMCASKGFEDYIIKNGERMEKHDFGAIHDAQPLRKLIAENPDLPIVVLVGNDAACYEYAWTYCTSVSCGVDNILDVKTPYDGDGERVFTDEIEFEEEISDQLFNDETAKLSDEQYDAMVQAEVEKYAPYWRKVIAVYVTN
jgi:hypothetical protein